MSKTRMLDKGQLPAQKYKTEKGLRLHGWRWRLTENVYRRIREAEIKIPKGYNWDGASVPKIVTRLTGIRPDGPYLEPALWHDFLYEYEGDPKPHTGKLKKMSRWSVDLLFVSDLKEAGVSWWRRWLAFVGVRLMGRVFWNRLNLEIS